MARNINIALFENVDKNAYIVEKQLNNMRQNYTLDIFKTKQDFIKALKNYSYDIILSNLSYSYNDIFKTVKKYRRKSPLIFLFGNLNKKTYAELIESGVWDIISEENIEHLTPALINALKYRKELLSYRSAKNNLEITKNKYSDLYKNSPDILLTFNFNTGIVTECNKALSEKTGYKKSELTGHSIIDFYPTDFLKNIKEKYVPLILNEGKIENAEIQIVKKNKEILYGTMNAQTVKDNDGRITSVMISVRDTTEIKKKEKALQQSEKRFKLIFDKSPDPMLIINPEIKPLPVILKTNPAAEKILKKTGVNGIGKTLDTILPHIPEHEIAEVIKQIIDEKSVREKITLKTVNNKLLYFDVNAFLLISGNKKLIIATARDVTLQYTSNLKLIDQKNNFKTLYEDFLKQNERLEDTVAKLYKSRKKLSKIIDIIKRSPVAVFSWKNTPGWPVISASGNISTIFEYSPEDFTNKKILYEDIIYSEDLPRVKKEVYSRNEDEKISRFSHKPYRIVTKSKKIKWVKDDTIIIRRNGKVVNYEGIITDITENVKYQKAIEASEYKYRNMLEASPDIIMICSDDKKVQYMNQQAVKKFGFVEKGDICYKSIFGFNSPCEWCGHKFVDKYETYQNEIIIPGEDNRYLLTFSKTHNTDGHTNYMACYKDVTDLRKLQTERLQFLNVLEHALNEVYILNTNDFSIKYVNTKPVRNLGLSKEEIKQRKLYEFQEKQSRETYKRHLKNLKSGKTKEVYFETKQKNAKGKLYSVSVNLQLIKKAEQNKILAFVNDISERKQQEELLKLLSTVTVQSPVSIVITDIEGNIEYVNPKFCELTGWGISEAVGQNPRILKSGKQSTEFYEELWNTLTEGKVWRGEFCNKKKNGELYWEQAIINPVKDETGNITHYIAIKEDITEKKQIYEKLLLSESRFRLLFENSLIGMYLTTEDGTILNANKALCKMLGYNSFDELKNVNVESRKDIIINRAEFKAEIEKNGYVTGFESIWENKNNHILYVRENARKYKGKDGTVYYEGTIEDITDEKRKEKDLQKIHELNKRIIDVGKLGYAVYKINGDCVFASENYAKILGTDKESVLKLNFRDKENWIKLQLIDAAEKCLKTGLPVKRLIEGKSSFNKDVWIELNFSRIYKDIEPQLLVIIKDISSYMKAKRRQIQTKSEYLSLIGSINVPIFGIDTEGKIKEWNYASETLTGYSKKEVRNKYFKDIFLIKSNPVFENFINHILSGNNITNEELDIIGKNGKTIRMLISSTVQIDENEKINRIICIAQDITQREIYKADLEKKVEERTHKLIEALKKEKELSELKSKFVSMASHEFRTPLSAIKFAAGFVKKYYDKAEKIKILQKAEKIETQVNHMTKLLEDVLTIGKIDSGKIKYNPVKIDIIKELKTIIEDVTVATKNSHKINFKYNKPEYTVISDIKILRNIFINLLSNAVKFSPNADEVIFNMYANEKYVKFEVQDKGIGINPEELKSIFNPFRRGRDVETIQGTGLGLAIVKESTELLKGNIKVESKQGEGTKFTVILPRNPKEKLN